MLEGKSMPSNLVANTNHTTLLKNQSVSPLNAFPLKFKIMFSTPSIFGISKIPTHCLKETLVMWPLTASGLFQLVQISHVTLSHYILKGRGIGVGAC